MDMCEWLFINLSVIHVKTGRKIDVIFGLGDVIVHGLESCSSGWTSATYCLFLNPNFLKEM